MRGSIIAYELLIVHQTPGGCIEDGTGRKINVLLEVFILVVGHLEEYRFPGDTKPPPELTQWMEIIESPFNRIVLH